MRLASEKDFTHWWRERLKAKGEASWSSCIDGHVVQALLDMTDPRGAFWPLLVYLAALRDYRLNSHRKQGGLISVTRQALPFIPQLTGRAKRNALDVLSRAGLVEVQPARGRRAPQIRLLYLPKTLR